MTRARSIRGIRTVVVGTAFLGFGCTQDNDPPKQVDIQPPFAEPQPEGSAAPQSGFTGMDEWDPGWVTASPKNIVGKAESPETALRKGSQRELLATVSVVPILKPAAVTPAADIPVSAATELPVSETPPTNSQFAEAFDGEALGSEAEIAEPVETSVAEAPDAVPVDPPQASPADPDQPSETPPNGSAVSDDEPTDATQEAVQASEVVDLGSSPVELAREQQDQSDDLPAALEEPPTEPVAQERGSANAPAETVAEVAIEEKPLPARRSVPARSQAPQPGTLAAAMPQTERTPIMASVLIPRPDTSELAPANDTGPISAPESSLDSAPASDPASAPTPDLASAPASAQASVPTSNLASAPATNLASAIAPMKERKSILGPDVLGPDLDEQQDVELAKDDGGAFAPGAVPFTSQDELILELKVAGYNASDTIIAYDTREGIYLPLGTLVRILDLAVRVSDSGNYAFGWVLREDRTVSINLREGTYALGGEDEQALPRGFAVAFDDEMFLRAEDLSRFIPVKFETSLRTQSVTVTTLEPFPFEERLKREADRKRLANQGTRERKSWPRSETPYQLATFPSADVQLRAVSNSGEGELIEADLTAAGDLLFMSAQAFLSANSEDGLTSSLLELGRLDPDGGLFGPLGATEFAIGDVASPTMPIGLRSVAGRGFTLSNAPIDAVSAFDRIDLRGVLQDGFEVELYRNGILIGSTRDRNNGRYEFLQVPVDFGLNVFRLVFYGPQGQRYEEVRNISVGDGRLAKGEFVYRIGAVQKDQNVLGVRDPDFIAPQDFGRWRGAAELSYGLSSELTAVVSGAWFETATEDRWTTSAGLRTGLGRFAIRADIAASSDSAYAFSGGIGARIGQSGFTFTHVEYSGQFLDETRSLSSEFLRRATELDFNTSIELGNPITGLVIPVSARLRHLESLSGRKQTSALLRASTRRSGMLFSNTFEYSRTSQPGVETFYQMTGTFDLATLGRSRTRARASVGYELLPNPDILSAGLEVDHALGERTLLRASANYVFASKSTQISASARHDFDRFSLSLDGSYAFRSQSYALGLRLSLSFGRDPASGRFFTTRQSLAGSGTASFLAFQDKDGDGRFGPGDEPLPEVDVIAFNATSKTDKSGVARLTGLGNGRPVSIQLDKSTLPDILMAPATDGFEIVPRIGRVHAGEIPVVALSEVEGIASLLREGKRKEVSGVRLELRDPSGKPVAFAKTEVDGYYFFERVKPGRYTLAIDNGQASRLGICLDQEHSVEVGGESEIVSEQLTIVTCS